MRYKTVRSELCLHNSWRHHVVMNLGMTSGVLTVVHWFSMWSIYHAWSRLSGSGFWDSLRVARCPVLNRSVGFRGDLSSWKFQLEPDAYIYRYIHNMYTDPDPQFLAPAPSLEVGQECPVFWSADLASLNSLQTLRWEMGDKDGSWSRTFYNSVVV